MTQVGGLDTTQTLLALVVFALAAHSLTSVAMWYGRSKPGGSDPLRRQSLYCAAGGLWVGVLFGVLYTALR